MDADIGAAIQTNSSSTSATLSNPMTIVALVNGMIGGIILVMPILALKSGYIMIAPVVLVSGFFSYYSCLLCLKHLRNFKDLDEAVLHHFGNKKSYKIFYDLCIAISLIVLLILYFDLICKQWEGIASASSLIPVLNALALFPAVYLMKKYHLGASLLAYGIISTIGYCIFLIYMWSTAPQGQKVLQPVDKHFPQLAAALSQGFAIQAFFIPVLNQNSNRKLYKRLLIITYFIGVVIYMYIGYGGALSILNKVYPGIEQPQTITEYFSQNQWEVVLVQIIYLIHLYSAFPQFLLISKKRIFNVFQISQNTNLPLLIYTGAIILLCLVVKIAKFSVQTIIQLNGSVISFVFIVVIPVGLHVKCVYFSGKDRHTKWEDEVEGKRQVMDSDKGVVMSEDAIQSKENGDQRRDQQISQQKEQNRQSIQQKQKQQNEQKQLKIFSVIKQTIVDGPTNSSQIDQDHCDIQYKSKWHQLCEMLILFAMVLSGVATMFYTIYLLVSDENQIGDT